MGAYLIDHPPVRDQWFRQRSKPLTGCTVLHTSEGAMDTVGPDTGTQTLAEFIRRRTTPGCYHDAADSDSWLHIAPYEVGAYHDGTGSNNWALSISFVCRTTDWDKMSPERRTGFLRNGARAFANQQAWRRAHRLPLTDIRRISKAQSDRGESGFVYHGDRDPGRRSDPGVSAPNDFPLEEFLHWCRVETGNPTPPPGGGGGGGQDGSHLPTLKYGMRDDERVARLQSFCDWCAWNPPLPLLAIPGGKFRTPEGTYGGNFLDKTLAVVKAAQRQCGLGADGVVGPATNRAFWARGWRG